MLEQMQSGVKRGPLKTMLYGAEGVGKSTFCAAPGVAWICAEDGVKHLNIERLPTPETWGDLLAQVRAYIDEPHNFWGLVVDSVDWCEMLAIEFIARRENKTFAAIPYGKGPVMLNELMVEFLKLLDQLVKTRGLDIYLIAHAQIVQFDDPSGESYSRWSPALNKKVLPPFKEWVDCLLFAQSDSYITTVGGGFKERKIAKGNGSRVMYLEHCPTHDAKNRFNLPQQMPLDHNAYRQGIENFYQSLGV